MSKFLHGEITREIIGAGFEVHTALGPGFLEKIYEEAMAHELRQRGIKFARQLHVPIVYKGAPVGDHFLDLLVEDKVIVELKAVKELDDVHTSVALSYLAATNLSVALILNFGKRSLEHRRVVR